MHANAVFQSARPPFLILTPMCVLLGLSTVSGSVEPALVVLVMIGALLAHISVNALNEYFDFQSGLDLTTARTPFSGGSGALPACPEAAAAVLALGVSTLLITMAIGAYLVWLRGWPMLVVGLLGVVMVASYTPWLNRRAWLCLIAPGAGFGLSMVLGSQLALGGQISAQSVVAALVPFFLVNNLLLLNQFPDIDADRAVGRSHLLIRHGVGAGTTVYGVFVLAAALSIVAGVSLQVFPPLSLAALLPLVPALLAWRGVTKLGAGIGSAPQFLAMNVATAVVTPLILALTLMYAATP